MGENKMDLDYLLQTDGGKKKKIKMSLENSKKYMNTKRQMHLLCNDLSAPSSEYKPDKMVKTINSYLTESNRLDRMLYAEISNYIFGLASDDRGIFLTNAEKLFLYAIDENNKVQVDSRKIVIKIYDHVQLATHQIENANNIFNNSIVDAKSKLHDEIKGIEREYITILGIFASIVLAFVGGITFTTSVLQNIDKASIFRLILTVDVIGAVLINVIYLLISFILRINEKDNLSGGDTEDSSTFIKTANWVIIVIAGMVIIAWVFNFIDLQEYISRFLFWTSN